MPQEIDFDALNKAINESAECNVVGCDRRVAGDGVCMGCFMGLITGDVVWDDKLKRNVKKGAQDAEAT